MKNAEITFQILLEIESKMNSRKWSN